MKIVIGPAARWREGVPIAGTIAEVYLKKRGLLLPDDIDDSVLRFHPACPFGERSLHVCLLALIRDIHSNHPCAIQRTALTPTGEKLLEKHWAARPARQSNYALMKTSRSGLPSAKASRQYLVPFNLGLFQHGHSLTPPIFGAFPVLSGIDCLTILVDHDENSTGQKAAIETSKRWTGAGREVLRAVPDIRGADFNDVIQSVSE
jgi:putative DNA primase/helicase